MCVDFAARKAGRKHAATPNCSPASQPARCAAAGAHTKECKSVCDRRLAGVPAGSARPAIVVIHLAASARPAGVVAPSWLPE